MRSDVDRDEFFCFSMRIKAGFLLFTVILCHVLPLLCVLKLKKTFGRHRARVNVAVCVKRTATCTHCRALTGKACSLRGGGVTAVPGFPI